MKTGAKVFVGALILLVACSVYGIRSERHAERAAREFCSRIQIGGEFGAAQRLAESAGEDRLRSIRAERITVGFTGLPPWSRHLCDIEREGDRVLSASYRYLD